MSVPSSTPAPAFVTDAADSPDSAAAPVLRVAVATDLEFILGQIRAGALGGHFDRRMLADERQDELRRDVEQIIRTGRRSGTGLPAEALVLSLPDGQPVGHAILTAVKEAEGIELYAMALDPSVRGNGYGRLMLNQILQKYLPRAGTIYARCFPASVAMYEMLVNSGFEYLFTMRHSLVRVLRIATKPA